MCYPIAFAAAAAAYAAYSTYQSEKEQGKADLAVARYNARLQENEAIKIRNKGVEEENVQRAKTAKLLETQRAQVAASGAAVDEGSALSIYDSTALEGNLDALRIRSNYRDQAQAEDDRSKLTLLQGNNARKLARIRGVYGGISNGISTGMSVYGGAK